MGDADAPAVWRRDLTGRLLDRIEVGHPSAERLHKGTRGAERVAVYCWRHPDRIVKDLISGQVFRGRDVELFVIDVALLDAVATTLTRNQRWSLSVSGGVMYLEIGGAVHSGAAERRFLPAP